MKKFSLFVILMTFFISVFAQNTIKTDIISNLLGGNSIADFISALIFAFLGAFVSLLLHTTQRNVNSTTSPVQFSFKFMFKDNWKRILTTFIFIIICVRFVKELTGLELNMFYAFAIGICNDKIVQVLKVKTSILNVPKTRTEEINTNDNN